MRWLWLAMMLLLFALVGCGEKEIPEEDTAVDTTEVLAFDAVRLLPEDSDEFEMKISGEVTALEPDSFAAKLGEAATGELADYSCLGVLATSYEIRGIPISLEIAQFETVADAYGYHARLRPDGHPTGEVGAESYQLGNTFYFCGQLYAATLSVDSASQAAQAAQILLAQEIALGIENAIPPRFFTLFPSRGKIEGSTRFYPHNFLGLEGLDRAYTTTYVLGSDSARFFIIEDVSGDYYLKLREYAESLGEVTPSAEVIPYYEKWGFEFAHPDSGRIVAGLVRAKLVGAIGYEPDPFEPLVAIWVTGLR